MKFNFKIKENIFIIWEILYRKNNTCYNNKQRSTTNLQNIAKILLKLTIRKEKQMKTIMIDMDDVITDGNFTNFLEEFLGKKINVNDSKVYYRQELIKGKEEEFKKIYQYKNLYENAPLLDGCYEVLKRLNEKYDIYIVTSYIWGKDIINPEENLKVVAIMILLIPFAILIDYIVKKIKEEKEKKKRD